MGEAPFVRWVPGGVGLVGQDGEALTNAQLAKARRYVEGGHVRHVFSSGGEDVAWGAPWRIQHKYELDPIPGCRQIRSVQVTVTHDGDDRVVGESYACDCQRARGTVSVRADACSHALAVHLTRHPKKPGRSPP